MVRDARELSGSGMTYEVRYLAEKDLGLEDAALKALVELEYQSAIRDLQNQLVNDQ